MRPERWFCGHANAIRGNGQNYGPAMPFSSSPGRWGRKKSRCGFLDDLGRLLSQNLVDRFVDRVLGDKSDNLLGNLTAFEDQQSRNSTNAVTHRRRGVGIYVHLHDLEF